MQSQIRNILCSKSFNLFIKKPFAMGTFARSFSVTPIQKSLNFSEDKNNNLRIKFNDFDFTYPSVWLRDNCQCEHCFHRASKSRIIVWKNFDVNASVKSMDVNEHKNDVTVKWNDGHTSVYNFDWLRERNFTATNKERYLNEVYQQKRVAWGKTDFQDIYKKFVYQEIMNDDEVLNDWLTNLRVYGVALVTGVPDSEKACSTLGDRVEFPRETHYGEEFIIRHNPETTNVAYLSSNLQLHTDLPYYEYKPGVNLLHCYIQAEGQGGDNLLSDGLYVANFMKKHHPESYRLLATTKVDWDDYGKIVDNSFHSMHRCPVFCLDDEGEITRINHSIPQRGSHFNVPLEVVKPWYEALKIFVDLIHEQSVNFKLSPGEILCFDNVRLVHGRNAYNDTQNNVRCIIGIYLDWDYIFSRMRVTAKKNNYHT